MSDTHSNSGATRSRWVRLRNFAATALVVQAFFWLVFNPIFISPPPAGEFTPYEVTDPQVAALTAPTHEALDAAAFEPLEDFGLREAPRGYGALRVNVTIPVVPKGGVGLLENGPGDNILVLVNGHVVFGEGKMELPDNSFDHLTRQRIRIPAAVIAEGENRIEIIHTQELGVEYVPGLPLVANYKEIEQAFGWKQFLMNEARMIASAIGFVITLFAGIALLKADSKRMLFWLFLVSLLWPLRNVFQLWPEIPLHGNSRAMYYSATTLGLAAAWPMLVDAWSEKSLPAFRTIVGVIASIASVVVLYWTYGSSDALFFPEVESVLDASGLLLMVATLGRFVWHMLFEPEDRYWEAAILLLLSSLMAVFLINTLLWDRHVGYLNLGQPLFLVAFAFAYFARNFRLFQSSSTLNTTLSERLKLRTAELEEAHSRETELVRREAHADERQRIMRDMHDGLGSSLMSMMLAARRGESPPEKVAEGLQSVIDEMRLMIDSMDSVGDSLASALATFRERTQARVEGAGFAFDWHAEDIDRLPKMGPRLVLQVFRIMQEAVTNSLKHSGGDRIVVSVKGASEEFSHISVSDNGTGLGNSLVVGHGLDNMKSRARALGAHIDVASTEEGVTVSLVLSQGYSAENKGQVDD